MRHSWRQGPVSAVKQVLLTQGPTKQTQSLSGSATAAWAWLAAASSLWPSAVWAPCKGSRRKHRVGLGLGQPEHGATLHSVVKPCPEAS